MNEAETNMKKKYGQFFCSKATSQYILKENLFIFISLFN
jgi:hypothetical protein